VVIATCTELLLTKMLLKTSRVRLRDLQRVNKRHNSSFTGDTIFEQQQLISPLCSSLSQRPLRTHYCHLRSSASAICSASAGSTRSDRNWTTKFHSQRTSHMEPSTTSAIVTGPVREHLQARSEDAPVLDRPVPLRRIHDSGTKYKYSDLITYLLNGPSSGTTEVIRYQNSQKH